MVRPKSLSSVEYFQNLSSQIENIYHDKKIKSPTRKAAHNSKTMVKLVQTFPSAIRAGEFANTKLLSQIPFFAMSEKAKIGGHKDFDWIAKCVSEFIVSMEKVFHTLLWEPFFCGFFCPANEVEFVRLEKCFTGAKIWFGQVYISKSIRDIAPNGEIIHSLHDGLQTNFFPYRSFTAMKIHHPHDSLRYYVNAFSGRPNKGYPKEFNQQFLKYYKNQQQGFSHLFRAYKKADLFPEFYERFCKIEHIPMALPASLLNVSPANAHEYCQSIFTKGFREISKLSKNEISAIQLRRSLQIRAYSIFQLRSILRHRLYSSESSFDGNRCLAAMDTYLNTLREHLLALAQNQQISKIEKSASRQDVWYSRVIQHQLRIGKVRSLPKSEFLPRQTSEILQDILPLVNFARNPKSTEILLHEIALIGGYLEKRQKWKAKKKVEKLTRIEAVVDRQTSLLQEISPKENIFREYF